jgi:carbon storage regulator CsrA
LLVITRKKGERVIIADNIEITIIEVNRNRVRFGVQAPKDVVIHSKLKASPPDDLEQKSPTEETPDS